MDQRSRWDRGWDGQPATHLWFVVPDDFIERLKRLPMRTSHEVWEVAASPVAAMTTIEPGRWPETTVLVPVGSTRTVERVANNPGDWAMHCHMTHHVMTQMGHGLPNTIGVDSRGLDTQVRKLLPGYMTMGPAWRA